MKKAQVSMEVMTLGAIMTLVLVIATVIFVNQYYDVSKQKELETLNLVSQKIKSELELAKNAEPGYYRSFIIPDKINGKEVKVEVYVSKEGNFSEVRVKFDPPISEYIESTALIGEAVFGSVNTGENKIQKNEEGVIIIPETLPENAKMNVSYVKIISNNTQGILQLKDGVFCDFFVENYNSSKNPYFNILYTLTLPNNEIINYEDQNNIQIDNNGYPIKNYASLNNFNLDLVPYNNIPEGSNLSCKVTMYLEGNLETFNSQNKLTLTDTLPEIIVLESYYDSGFFESINMNSSFNKYYAYIKLNISDIDVLDENFTIDFINSKYLDCNNETIKEISSFNSCTNNIVKKDEINTFNLPLINSEIENLNENTIPITIKVTNKDNQEEITRKEITIEKKTSFGSV